MILEKIFFIEIIDFPEQNAHIFMGRFEKKYFARVQTACKKISPFIFHESSRDAYDKAKDWFYLYYDGFLQVTTLDEKSFHKEANNFVNTNEQ